MRLLLAAIALAAPTAASAADWWYVATDSRGSLVYVDMNSIDRKGDIGWANEKWDNRNVAGEPVREKRMVVHYDCRQRASAVVTATSYSADRKPMGVFNAQQPPLAFRPVERGTVAAKVQDIVCQFR